MAAEKSGGAALAVAPGVFGDVSNAPNKATTHRTTAGIAQKKPLKAQTGDGPQPPTDVVARRAAQRWQRAACRTVQPAPVHPVVGLGVADHRLDSLPLLEQARLFTGEQLVLAAVDGLHARVVGVHTPVAQVDDDLPGQAFPQRLALPGTGLLHADAGSLGGADHPVADDVQQAAVGTGGRWL